MKPGIYEINVTYRQNGEIRWHVSRRMDNGYAVNVGSADTAEKAESLAADDAERRGLKCSIRGSCYVA